ncbi:MAG: folate-binding protein [Salaquimonas sp.]
MSDPAFTELTNRALLNVTGEGAADFLQGIVTCEVAKLVPGEIAFGALLSPQGKILFDFFVVASTKGFIFDVEKSMAGDLAKRLAFYRLRAKIDIEPMDERTHVFSIWGANINPKSLLADGVICKDPRLAEMGYRAYIRRAPDGVDIKSMKQWNDHRIDQGMPEGGLDFSFGDAFPHEALMDQFKGIDFAKGCYVGQEVVSRMQHRGTARKRLIKVSASASLPNNGTEILSNGKACGSLTSNNGKTGIAMIRIDKVEGAGPLRTALAGSMQVELSIQDWCNFTWPDDNAS